MKSLKNKFISGHSLIELLIAMGVFGLIITPFLSSVVNLTSLQVKYRHQIQATQYAREGLEIAYNIAINTEDWASLFNLAGPDPYHPTSTGEPALEPNTEKLAGGRFERAIFLEEEDSDTLKVSSKVSWQERSKDQKVELTTYLINFGAIKEP